MDLAIYMVIVHPHVFVRVLSNLLHIYCNKDGDFSNDKMHGKGKMRCVHDDSFGCCGLIVGD